MQKHLGLPGARRTAPCAGPPGLLAALLYSSHAVGVNAGIDRIGEQVVQRGATDAAPFEIAFLRPAAHPHWHAYLMCNQICHHLTDRLEAIK